MAFLKILNRNMARTKAEIEEFRAMQKEREEAYREMARARKKAEAEAYGAMAKAKEEALMATLEELGGTITNEQLEEGKCYRLMAMYDDEYWHSWSLVKNRNDEYGSYLGEYQGRDIVEDEYAKAKGKKKMKPILKFSEGPVHAGNKCRFKEVDCPYHETRKTRKARKTRRASRRSTRSRK